MASKNQAAWIKQAKGNPLVVEDAPFPTPKAGEVVIKNAYVAVNPVDYKIQDTGYIVQNFPAILGEDVAGTIEAVGEGVTGLAQGDRVLAFAAWLALGANPVYSAFQHYTLALAHLVTKVPAGIALEAAATLPLGLATAAHGLFAAAFLNLARPSTAAAPDAGLADKSLLVWGGSSSVGASAVQLAARAGYTVVATASPHNFALVTALGATHVFDHRDADVVVKARAAVRGEWVGAFDAISEGGSVEKSASVIGRGKVATTLIPPKDLPEGITAVRVFAGLLAAPEKELGQWLFNEYLPVALADGSIRPAPEALVVGAGLDAVQGGIDVLRKGVSGKKVVVRVDAP